MADSEPNGGHNGCVHSQSGNGDLVSTICSDAIVQKAKEAVRTCPFGHGSVGVGPYPGYKHGRHPAICPAGCEPDPTLDRHGREGETPHETLIREALEYQELYHHEKGSTEAVKQARIAEILAEIKKTGTYTHTFDELQHGARVAWRNAPKCANRKFWEELNLLDYRHVDTPEGMFRACLELLEAATLSCVTTANIVCFRPQTPGTQDGPRVWNSQLIRFAGYRQPDGTILGDKAEADFTTMIKADFGWEPPFEKSRFDVLPLVLQTHPNDEPKMFHLPKQYVPRVPISHPDYPQIAELGLQWYAVPAVSNIELSVGGLLYTAAPFNGWYAVTEIVRNLCDENRYDQTAAVATKLGLDMRSDGNMWRDQAIVTVTQAVMSSFRAAGYGMVDHHTLMKNFWSWYNREKERRGFAPGNWKWIIPPVSPTANIKCYLELNKMTDYTLKPGYWMCPGWKAYRERLRKERISTPEKAAAEVAKKQLFRSMSTWRRAAAGGDTFMLIIYASVTGTTAKYAEAVAGVIRSIIPVAVVNVEDFEPDGWFDMIERATFVVLMTSTYGPGAPPSSAGKFLSWVQKGVSLGGEARDVFDDKPFAVLGFGCTSYPRFCAAADTFQTLMCATGAEAIMGVTKVDCLSHEEVTVWGWARELLSKVAQKGLLDPHVADIAVANIPITLDGKPKPFVPCYTLIDLAGVQGVRPAIDRFRSEATVVEVVELRRCSGDETANGGESTKHVILDVSKLPGGGSSYLAGDELAVWAENPSEAVATVAAALGLHGSHLDAMFLLQDARDKDEEDGAGPLAEADEEEGRLDCAPFPLPNSFRTILTRYIALYDKPSYEAVCALPQYAPEDERLAAIAKSYASYQEWVSATGTRWCDMWKEFPTLMGRVPPSVFFQLAPTIKPRHYSISSSASKHPGQLHLTVSRLSYRLPSGEVRDGFCSSFLATRKPGDRVGVKVLPTPGFRMPLNPSAPVIMVAAGTGIAPFKSFWEERQARSVEAVEAQPLAEQSSLKATGGDIKLSPNKPTNGSVTQQLGPGVLIFGCRNSTTDYIYSNTVEDALAMGALSRVITAFSREPSTRKQYVQDAVVANADELKPLLAAPGCHVYVCGSSNMAQEVALAFQKVMGPHEFTKMVDAGRYHEDVFGIVIPDYSGAIKAAAARGTLALLGNATPAEVAEMLDSGALTVDALDHAGRTLLHIAVQASNAPLVQMLLERGGCAMNVLDMYGYTPLQLARVTGQPELAALLESRGGRLVSRLVSQFYPLHAAVMENDLEAVRAAIADGANLAAAEFHGLTPLHVACSVAGEEIIKALIAAGAPLDATTRRGLLPLQQALILQRTEAADLLQAAGAPLVVEHVVSAGHEGDAGSNSSVAWSPQTSDGLLAAVGLTEEELAALQGSWAFLSGVAFPPRRARMEQFSTDFFLSLFDQCPHLLRLFPFKDCEGQPLMAEIKAHAIKVFSMIGSFLMLLSNYSVLDRIARSLVARHIGYGVEQSHYEVFINLQLDFISKELGPLWDDTNASAWRKVFALLRKIVQSVYEQKQQAQERASAA